MFISPGATEAWHPGREKKFFKSVLSGLGGLISELDPTCCKRMTKCDCDYDP